MRSSSSSPPPFRADAATNPLNRVVFAQRTLMFLNLKSFAPASSFMRETKRLVQLSTVCNTFHDTIANYAAPLFDQWFQSENASVHQGSNFPVAWIYTCAYRIGFSLNFVQHFLAAGASPNAECTTGYHVVRRTAGGGHSDVLALLFAAGGDVEGLTVKQQQEEHPQTALMIAARRGDAACVRLLIDSGAAVDRRSGSGLTPLHCAAQGRSGEVVEMLLAAGADAHATADSGWTALHFACSELNDGGPFFAVVKALVVSGGVDVNAQIDRLGARTGLMQLAYCDTSLNVDSKMSVCKFLLDAGADTEVVDSSGNTALLLAVTHAGQEDHVAASFVAALAKGGANLEARPTIGGWMGWTAIMIACANGYHHCVRALVDAGARLPATDAQGKTALDIARARDTWNCGRCVEILEDAVAAQQGAGARRERE